MAIAEGEVEPTTPADVALVAVALTPDGTELLAAKGFEVADPVHASLRSDLKGSLGQAERKQLIREQ